MAKKAESPGATVQLFQAEHRKLNAMADKLAKGANELSDSPDLDAALIALLDN